MNAARKSDSNQPKSKTILLFGFPEDQQIEPGHHTILRLPAGLDSVLSDEFVQNRVDLVVFYPNPNLFALPHGKRDALALLSHLAQIETPIDQAESGANAILQANLRALLDLAVEKLVSVVFNSGRASEQGPKYTFLILPHAVDELDDVTREIWEGWVGVDCSHQGPLDFLDLTKYSTREIGVAEQIPEIRAVISRHMSKLKDVMCTIPFNAGRLNEPGESWDMLNDHLNRIADSLERSASLKGRTISPSPATFRIQGYPLLYDRGSRMAAALARQANVFVFFLPYIADTTALVRDLIQTLFAPPAPASQENRFVREGVFWTIRFQGADLRPPKLKGLSYIHSLLRQPNKELRPEELIALDKCPPVADPLTVKRLADETRGENPALQISSAIETKEGMITKEGIKAIKKRLLEIERERAKAKEIGDEGACEDLANEKDQLIAHLKKCTRLLPDGDMVIRPMPNSPAEKARKAVGIAISRAIKAIKKENQALAKHLFTHILFQDGSYRYRTSGDETDRWTT